MAKTLLFSYGQLKSYVDPPKTMTHHQSAAVRGVLYDLGPDVALQPGSERTPLAAFTDPNHRMSVAHGELLWIDDSELPELDRLERHAGYKREQIRECYTGQTVWVYVWQRPIPKNAKMVSEWRPEKKVRTK